MNNSSVHNFLDFSVEIEPALYSSETDLVNAITAHNSSDRTYAMHQIRRQVFRELVGSTAGLNSSLRVDQDVFAEKVAGLIIHGHHTVRPTS